MSSNNKAKNFLNSGKNFFALYLLPSSCSIFLFLTLLTFELLQNLRKWDLQMFWSFWFTIIQDFYLSNTLLLMLI